jgi:2-deoxy-D-gluconate 3-dehydrogenase
MDGRNPFSLEGAVALVTGAGSGIGRVTAKVLGAYGAILVVTELPSHMHLARSLIRELDQTGVQARAFALDVRDSGMIADVVNKVVADFGRLDILVNNAGVQLLRSALLTSDQEYDEVMAVNLRGAFLCAKAAAAIMVRQQAGCVINVASQHGVVGNKNRAAYCASKGGLVNLTRALAVEWAEYNIRVNAISPTFVTNEQNQEVLASSEFRNQIKRGIPLNRPAGPDDIAYGICYLASPAACMITGHNLLIDGGWTAR